MAVEIVAVPCPAGEYTLIADSKSDAVGVQLRGKDAARLAIAASKPAASSTDYFSLRPDTSLSAAFAITSAAGLAGTERFWLMPETGAAITVEVVRA